MKCHCKSELTPHDAIAGVKVGALHCYGCGCCFLSDGKTPREGVPVCALAAAAVSEEEAPPVEQQSEAPAPEPEAKPAPRRTGRARK